MDEELLRVLSELLEGLELAVQRARSELAKIIDKEVGWQVIKAEKAVSAEDAAIKWLMRKLAEIKQKHPSLEYSFVKDSGLITALRFRAEDSEIQEDVESVCSWAFSKACSRPSNSSKGGGEK